MNKEYRVWHGKKQFLHNDKERPFFHDREIRVCHMGENVGFEQDGRGEEFLRPIIVLKKFNNEILWAIPLTKVKRKRRPYFFVFSFRSKEKSTALLSQIRLIDAKRLKYKIGYLSEDDFHLLKAKLKQLIA